MICVNTTVALEQFNNEEYSLLLLGEPRQYAQKSKVDATWLIQQLSDNPSIESLYPRISGRFVIIIVNKRTETLHLFNDHLGSLPLYYTHSGNGFCISTSLQGAADGILQTQTSAPIGPELSHQAIFNYIYFHCIPAPLTIYENIYKLCPAELIQITPTELSSQGTLYRPSFVSHTPSAENLSQQCLETIEAAVAANLPEDRVGAFLSGGLDSSTVAGMLKKITGKAKTFSIGFNEKGYDETEFALITARHFDTDHSTHYLEPDYISDNFSLVATSFDEPFGNSSALAAYYCASEAKKSGITTLLAGDGGDEFFAGNSRYAKQKLFYPFEQSPGWLKQTLRSVFVNTPLTNAPLTRKVASYIKQADNPLPDRLQSYNFLHRFSAEEIFTESFLSGIDRELPLKQLRHRYSQADATSPVDRMLYLDWKFTLADNDLIKVSKMCELAGVTVNFPLIEKELVDFSCQIPSNIKLPGQKLRHFYKSTTAEFLAPETLAKSKHGFGLPFGRWMRSNPKLIDITEKSLAQIKSRDIFKPEFIDKIVRMQSEEHAAYYGELIWILTVLELWLRSREL
ncbi:asparagine synthase [Aestuariicella hydrocarbonica]|uniref:asparagine synthase (glutamine-hydrolyzing) n=2 Tax=Pseudomaricurvus hydrocarbonicus TaxID=1470433 RepID=A0A9E5JQL4_9GAMM|nr:asparagine synthase [Aestuariicella hydrocarbonica]